jgi:hypothetical protein
VIEIVLTVCLLAAPDDCRREHVPFPGGIVMCAGRGGQEVAAEWIAAHPKYRLRRYRCGVAEQHT